MIVPERGTELLVAHFLSAVFPSFPLSRQPHDIRVICSAPAFPPDRHPPSRRPCIGEVGRPFQHNVIKKRCGNFTQWPFHSVAQTNEATAFPQASSCTVARLSVPQPRPPALTGVMIFPPSGHRLSRSLAQPKNVANAEVEGRKEGSAVQVAG